MNYAGNPDYVDTRGAAELCNLKPMTLHNYRHFGRGPAAIRDGRRVFYRVSDVTSWNKGRPKRARKG